MSSEQHPLPSGFTADSTADDVIQDISLVGKIAIVTGGYAGIGQETVRAFARAGANVIVGARDLMKANRALAGMKNVEVRPLDLIRPDSIDAFAESFVEENRPLHLLVNNAGIMATPLTRDARGYEAQFATNHLGHFQLTARLWPALAAADGARVVNVSSAGHRYSPVVFDDPSYQHREYEKYQAYGQSKTANILFSVELDRLGQAHGVRSFALHPGVIFDTDLARHLTDEDYARFGVQKVNGQYVLDTTKLPFKVKTRQQGASTTVWCAVSPRLDGHGGVYCEDTDIAAPADPAAPILQGVPSAGVHPWAIDPAAARRLWQLSERLTGVAFAIRSPIAV